MEFKFNLTQENASQVLRIIYKLGRQYDWNPSVYINTRLQVVRTQYSAPTINTEVMANLEEALETFYTQAKELGIN